MASRVRIEKRATYSGHAGSIYAIALNEAHTCLYSVGDDGVVACWQLDKYEDQGEGLLKFGSGAYALEVIDEREILAVGGSDGTLYLFDLKGRKLLFRLRQHSQAIYGFYFESSRDYLWILYGGGYLGIMRMADFKMVGFLKIAENHLRCIQPLNQQMIIGTSDKRIMVLNQEDARLLQSWEAHDNSVFSIAINPGSKYLLSGGRDAYLNIWDLQENFTSIKKIPAHNFTINDISLGFSGDYFATASRDKTIKLWDAYSFELLKVIDHKRNESHKNSVNKIKWLKNSDNSLISCGDDKQIFVWQFFID